jgi:hypothetical protein
VRIYGSGANHFAVLGEEMASLATWDDRYGRPEYIYGTEANQFLVTEASRFPPHSRILALGEGEGRNGVFLMKQGHKVTAVDSSRVGLDKAVQLAESFGMRFDEVICADLAIASISGSFACAYSIFCHLPSKLRRVVHQRILTLLEPGGLFLIEMYQPTQVARGTGGPKDTDFLVSLADLRGDFEGCDELLGKEITRDVVEGTFHTGTADVVQAIFRKRTQ